MAEQTPEKSDRNKALIEDYLTGTSFIRLVSKYKINSARIYQILKSHKVEKNRKLLKIGID